MKWVNVNQDATDAGEAIIREMIEGDGMSERVSQLIERAVREHDAADLVRGLGNLSSTLVTVLAMRDYERPSAFFEQLVRVEED